MHHLRFSFGGRVGGKALAPGGRVVISAKDDPSSNVTRNVCRNLAIVQ